MNGIIVSLYAMTASFRDPNTHLYQESILAPPPTTIVGIAGAALGYGFKDALEYFKENRISVGCMLKSQGNGKDLWNYSKIKGKEVVKAILLREFLFDVTADIFFACEDGEKIDELYDSLKNPQYALSLGNSDDVVKILKVDRIINVKSTEDNMIRDTWIEGNYIKDFELDWENIKGLPIKRTIKPPIVKNLPVDFSFTKNDERIATKFYKFTFLGDLHMLKKPVLVYDFMGKRVPLFTFGK
ncbi:CRISPR-associated protein Cas5 [Lutispora thermophila]|uniref:CRISPR-associated protein, Cas5 family n=1 Tax=Lutispora thermophila DSM 19022 TaxID=1122184 RepID=A0A1M6E9Q2_9FIRM|nr:CRISPR-associated protein Cas5 [Lutispora thermophila]SHI82099.1 CRISPR-associated protein, Cas5 family [Lutispora thermophila DSM 19022]